VIIKRLNLQTAGEGLTSTIRIYRTLVSSHQPSSKACNVADMEARYAQL